MKRVERELTQAQTYLYNVTDNIIGTSLSKQPEKPTTIPNNAPVVNTNTRFSPIPLETNDDDNRNKNQPLPAKDQVQDTV